MVLRSVLVPTPKLAPLTRRVNDEGLRARIVHAPETASDKARVLAEGGHAPRSPKYLQDDALRRLRIPAAHRPPVLARAKLSGQIRELIHERADLAVVANHQRLNLSEPEQACLDGARRRARHRAAVPRVEPARFVDVLTVHSLRPTLHRPAPALVFEVGLRVGGNAPMQKLALNEPIRPHTCISIRATFFQADNCQKIGLLDMLPEDIENTSKYRQSIGHIKVLSTAKTTVTPAKR